MKEDLQKAFETLKKGGIILYPTDTVWGLGCDPTNAEAVKRLYEIKKRKDEKSMLILVNSIETIYSYIETVPEIGIQLIEVSDKPLTIIFPGAKNLAKNLIAPDGSIGIRVTQEEFSSALIKLFKKPIVSTSANISGEPTPGNFNQISDQIIGSVDYCVSYKRNENMNSKPSSIIKVGIGSEIQIIRK
jgi:L-threonylcarbamoyladenylate synthase